MCHARSFQWAFYEATHNKTSVKMGNKRVCIEVHGLITLSLEYGWSTLELRGQGPLVERVKGLLFACFRWHYNAYDDLVNLRTNKAAWGVSTHSWGHETNQFLCQWCNIYINSYIHIYSTLRMLMIGAMRLNSYDNRWHELHTASKTMFTSSINFSKI